eukprot:6319005-Prymnesium_polylepis.1
MGKSKLAEEIRLRLAPRLSLATVQAHASSTELSDQFFVWRTVFQSLPRVLGLVSAAPKTFNHNMSVGFGDKGGFAEKSRMRKTGAIAGKSVEVLKELRAVYREWLYRLPSSSHGELATAEQSQVREGSMVQWAPQ